mmetsp:Transcript_27763/g.60709  ORF Transcript_27763/g.60709 Transcript_27763/m.60709 type:complete len:313 (-) Transcript_27763:60-998(-)
MEGGRPYSTFEHRGMRPEFDGLRAQMDSRFMGSVLAPGKRRINLVAICVNIFLPWIVFVSLFAVLSFSLHYQHPQVAWSLVALAFGSVLLAIFMAYQARRKNRDPMWYNFSAVTLLLATLLATSFGDMNFWNNMQPFYDVENLNTYPSVNPAREKGHQLMDAGRVYFTDGSGLDTRKAMGFKNKDIYCVAPISHGQDQPTSYDFWAVGINCCSGVSADFRCGDFNNPHARSGLRLMREDERAFFRLAVQQAEAAYNIKADYPLFFHWMQDPVSEMNSYRDAGFKYFLLGIFTHFSFNLFCVICAVVGFSKFG